MPTDRSRRYDDDDDDRPRRRRRYDDDDDDRPRRRREKSNTPVVVACVLGGVIALGGVVAAVIVANGDGPSRDAAGGAPANDLNLFDRDSRPDARPVGGAPAFDAEGLPFGNELDAILTRLNRRHQTNAYHLYQMEAFNLRSFRQRYASRTAEVFRAFRTHAGTIAGEPVIGTIPHAAWRNMMDWTTKDQVPDLCHMLAAEPSFARKSDILSKLIELKDPRCAAAVAPYLASQQHRFVAESLLKELDSTAEPAVLPYLSASHPRETRVAALQIVAKVGTKDGAALVEPMTRDADPTVAHHARIVFEELAKKYGVAQDLTAAVKAIKDGIAAQNVSAITDASRQLDAAYQPDHPRRAEIFKGLLECCKVNDPKGYGKSAAFNGAMKWSSKDDVGPLCELLVASGGESVVFLKLKEYKDPRTAPTLAAFLAVPLKGGEAAAVLKELGAAAEKAVAPYTLPTTPTGAAIPFATRAAAIELLGDVGTRDCVLLLRQLTADGQVGRLANAALAKVLARGN